MIVVQRLASQITWKGYEFYCTYSKTFTEKPLSGRHLSEARAQLGGGRGGGGEGVMGGKEELYKHAQVSSPPLQQSQQIILGADWYIKKRKVLPILD